VCGETFSGRKPVEDERMRMLPKSKESRSKLGTGFALTTIQRREVVFEEIIREERSKTLTGEGSRL
jgi:hypothetical protein